jgi:hypothetical protein
MRSKDSWINRLLKDLLEEREGEEQEEQPNKLQRVE